MSAKKNQVIDQPSNTTGSINKGKSSPKSAEGIRSSPMQMIAENGFELPTQKSSQDTQQKGSISKNKKQKLESQTSKDKEDIKPKKRLRSILLSQDSKGSIERKDQYGTAIVKGEKKDHRILFADEIEEVHEVENWKEYNLITPKSFCCAMYQMNFFYCAAA